jgi:hypothetical protein
MVIRTSWKCTNSWYINIFIWQFFKKRNYVEIIYRIKPMMKSTQNHIFWNSSKVKIYHSNMLFIFLWVQGYNFCTIWINRSKEINSTWLNIPRLNFNDVRKSCSDGKTFYTKIVEDLITNLMQEQPSRTDL